MDMCTVIQLIEQSADRLEEAQVSFGQGTTNAFDEAAWLVLWALGYPLDSLDDVAERKVTEPGEERARALIERRISTRQPAAYLTGEAWLQGVPFVVDERVIVPRSLIAECLAEGQIDLWLEQQAHVHPESAGQGEQPRRVLDLCTGNGSLAVLAAMAWPHAQVVGADLSEAALEVAALNRARHNLRDRIELLQGDGLAAVGSRMFDLILCNPPYVNAQSMAALPAEFLAEPQIALDGNLSGSCDGMDFIRPLLQQAGRHLPAHGLLVLEIGHERPFFEAAFPELNPVWLPTSAGDDLVLALTQADLLGLT